jgi:hypothetical protein
MLELTDMSLSPTLIPAKPAGPSSETLEIKILCKKNNGLVKFDKK